MPHLACFEPALHLCRPLQTLCILHAASTKASQYGNKGCTIWNVYHAALTRAGAVQAGGKLTAAMTCSTDAEAEATLAELRSTSQRSDQEVVDVRRCTHGGKLARVLLLKVASALRSVCMASS